MHQHRDFVSHSGHGLETHAISGPIRNLPVVIPTSAITLHETGEVFVAA